MTPMDDLTPKERELKRWLEHMVNAHMTTDISKAKPGCWQCENFKQALS